MATPANVQAKKKSIHLKYPVIPAQRPIRNAARSEVSQSKIDILSIFGLRKYCMEVHCFIY